MKRLPIDGIQHARPPASPLVEAVLSLVRQAAREEYAKSGLSWAEFAGRANGGVTAAGMAAVEQAILASGHRFDWSAAISVAERPEAYKPAAGLSDDPDFSFEHPEAATAPADAQGRELRGVGDNVVRRAENVRGAARYIRSNARVLAYLSEGAPPGTIAIIDDSGGTLTAPIIEQFAGIICAGGSVRSHLGILSREFGIPCFMNAKLSGVRDGDLIEMEVSAPAKTAEDYQTGATVTGRIWKLEAGRGPA